MKRKELNFVEAYKAYNAGEVLTAVYTGFFDEAGNTRTLDSETRFFKGMTYNTDFTFSNVMGTFREAIKENNFLMRSYNLFGAVRYIVRYFTETAEPETMQPETVADSEIDYYLPFH